MPKKLDLTNQVFGKLTVLKEVRRDNNGLTQWRVRCVCGNKKTVRTGDLQAGKVISCAKSKCAINYKHGYSRHPLYEIWRNMLDRCYNSEHASYHNYGGRGIRVCKRWHDLIIFINDITKSIGLPPKNMDFDRKNNNKGYRPNNVRWVTRSRSIRNTRFNRKIVVKGKIINLIDYYESKKSVVSYNVFSDRIRLGWRRKAARLIPLGTRVNKYNRREIMQ